MKSARILTALLLGTVLFGATAFAAEKAKIQVSEAVSVNGNQLPAGEYTVTWEGSGPRVELKFMKGKSQVATATAQLVKLDRATVNSQVITKHETSGVSLTEIEPGGKSFALQLSGEGAQTAAQN